MGLGTGPVSRRQRQFPTLLDQRIAKGASGVPEASKSLAPFALHASLLADIDVCVTVAEGAIDQLGELASDGKHRNAHPCGAPCASTRRRVLRGKAPSRVIGSCGRYDPRNRPRLASS